MVCVFSFGEREGCKREWLQSIQLVMLGAGPPSEHGSHWKSESLTETAKLPFIRLFKD